VRVIVHLTLDGTREIKIRGDSPFLGGNPGDQLEQKGLGFWLKDWHTGEGGPGTHKRSQVFIPWSSALYVEELGRR